MFRFALVALCAVLVVVVPPFGAAFALVVLLCFVFARMQATLNEMRGG